MIQGKLLFVAPTPIKLSNPISITSNRTIIRTAPQAALPPLSLSPTQQNVLTTLTLPTIPILAYSEYTLLSTGCGLPPGPYGLLGAAEGISYLLIAAVIGLSVYSKLSTGKGLPEGPGKLLGALEGFSFLLVTAGIAIAAYTAYKYGGLPEAVPKPGSRCFPVE